MCEDISAYARSFGVRESRRMYCVTPHWINNICILVVLRVVRRLGLHHPIYNVKKLHTLRMLAGVVVGGVKSTYIAVVPVILTLYYTDTGATMWTANRAPIERWTAKSLLALDEISEIRQLVGHKYIPASLARMKNQLFNEYKMSVWSVFMCEQVDCVRLLVFSFFSKHAYS